MTRRWLVRVALVAASIAGGAGMAVPAAAQDARLAAISDAEVRASIGTLIVEAERHGLPREPLVTKALEGVEKGAAAPRIEAAVRALVGRLLDARDALSVAATPEELRAAADALSAGVQKDAIRKVRAAVGNRSAAVALGVLAQLVARGVPSTRAADAVAQLLRHGATQPQLVALQREVQADLALGVPAATALELRTKQVIAALPPVISMPTTAAPANVPTAVPTNRP